VVSRGVLGVLEQRAADHLDLAGWLSPLFECLSRLDFRALATADDPAILGQPRGVIASGAQAGLARQVRRVALEFFALEAAGDTVLDKCTEQRLAIRLALDQRGHGVRLPLRARLSVTAALP
jgi:hypothetical protein